MSSFSSLLSLSPADFQIGGEDDDMAVAAAMSSYLSFDMADIGGDQYYLPEAAMAFHSDEKQSPPVAPLPTASLYGGDDDYKNVELVGGDDQSSKAAGAVQTSGGAGSLARSKGSKIAFKTRSEVDVLDDGYRWRKYGKKMVKNSPNPRNYYRCSREGCRVKKRVERERDDARFVVTTYDGVHNHPAPLPPRGCAGYSLVARRLAEAEEPAATLL